MSERPMAERHGWTAMVSGTELQYRVVRSGPAVLFEVGLDGSWQEASSFIKACCELLRVVAERDEARAILADQGRVLFIHGGDLADEQKVLAMRGHAKREAMVEALGKALLACLRAVESLPVDALGVGRDGELVWSLRDELLDTSGKALRDAGLLPEEEEHERAVRSLRNDRGGQRVSP